MSRTYRRRRWRQLWTSHDPLMDWYATEDEIVWEDVDYVKRSWDFGYLIYPRFNVKYSKNSKTGRRLIAKARSESGTHTHKEPGPGWFRNLYVTRPLRRKAKEELRKFMKSIPNLKNYGAVDDWYCYHDVYEPMILSDPPLPYWT